MREADGKTILYCISQENWAVFLRLKSSPCKLFALLVSSSTGKLFLLETGAVKGNLLPVL